MTPVREAVKLLLTILGYPEVPPSFKPENGQCFYGLTKNQEVDHGQRIEQPLLRVVGTEESGKSS